MAILGIDEVGRGPWAGPLVIGAVILPENSPDWVAELTDSKKLSTKKRERLNDIILSSAPAATLGWVSSTEIDEFGLAAALRLATRRAVKLVQSLHVPFSEIIIDGTVNFLADTPLASRVTVLKKADLLIKEVSAASIIAKVARDRFMVNLAKTYPGYGFEKHVGYGTALHQAALKTLGPCSVHRFSFRPVAKFNLSTKNTARAIIKNSLKTPVRTEVLGVAPKKTIAPDSSSTTTTGHRAELIVANFLKSSGHQIIALNPKTKFYEIDIISLKDEKIYFTEVKYRRSALRGAPLEAITPTKLAQMRFAASAFLEYYSTSKTHPASKPYPAPTCLTLKPHPTPDHDSTSKTHLASKPHPTHEPYSTLNSRPGLKDYSPVLAVAAVSGKNFHLDTWFPLD